MRWICLRNASRDVKLMFRRPLVGEIAIIDFHGYVTVGPPLLPRRMLKKFHHEELDTHRCVSLASHTVEQLPHPSFAVISYLL